MFNKLISRLKFWVMTRIMNWEEFWENNIPAQDAFAYDAQAKPVKNLSYYQQIAHLRKNKAFMNELGELQRKLERHVTQYLIANDLEAAKVYSARLQGAKMVNLIIVNAIEYENMETRNVSAS